MAPTSAISDARRFADLVGIGEEEPLAFLDPKMDVDRLVECLNFSTTMSDTAKAHFCARYLPTLVRSLSHPDLPPFNSFSIRATRALASVSDQPLWGGHFLRTSPEAEHLLATMVLYFTQIPTGFAENSRPELPPDHRIDRRQLPGSWLQLQSQSRPSASSWIVVSHPLPSVPLLSEALLRQTR
ncbi:hypothetical protein BDY24DRAFT_189548 [Mrakia frigida]|uniref:uncharacterized protein n=1 Tax=Mrakia frigida TaxID=29902 RepID=UPI003FCC23FD